MAQDLGLLSPIPSQMGNEVKVGIWVQGLGFGVRATDEDVKSKKSIGRDISKPCRFAKPEHFLWK